MRTVSITHFRNQMSQLVDEAATGEPFIIAKAGRPMVKVLPLEAEYRVPPRRIGFMASEIRIPDDFDEMGAEEIARMFYGPER